MGTASEKAAQAFKAGKLVTLPTETVYGLAAPYNDLRLVKRIFELKQRPLFDPLIVHVSDIPMAKTLVRGWSTGAQRLAEVFWPGPLTLVLPKLPNVDDLVTAGQATVGVRCPNHPIALEMIKGLQLPLVAPSANVYQALSPTSIEQVKQYFSPTDVEMFDGGDCRVGIESTIVGLDEDKNEFSILRKGLITEDDLKTQLTNFKCIESNLFLSKDVHLPGSDDRHYRPKKDLVLVYSNTLSEEEIRKKSGLSDQILFSEIKLGNDPFIAARSIYKNLFEYSQRISLENNKKLLIRIDVSFLEDQKWSGIIDRLRRAASLIVAS